MKQNRGSSLLELLLVLAVFMSILPFVYNMALDQKGKIQNNRAAQKIMIVRDALEQYVSDNRQKLLAPVSRNVTRIKLVDLNLDTTEFDQENIQLRIVKSKDVGGRSFVQGIVIFDSDDLTPLRTRQIAESGGFGLGFVDGNMLYGSFGTWRSPMSSIEAVAGANSVLAGTRAFGAAGDYLERLPSQNDLGATMQSDLDMGGHNVENVKSVMATSAKFLESLSADSIETSKMTVTNRLNWDTGIEVSDEVVVHGPMVAENQTLDSTQITVSGKSQFRSVVADDLLVQNLFLSGLSIAEETSEPAILSISGALDMVKGHIQAMDTIIGFSGSVAPKLVVDELIEDSKDPQYFWNLSNSEARLADLQLDNLSRIAKTVLASERNGKTQTEQLFDFVAQNSNATIADYLKVMEQIKQIVTIKYNQLYLNP